MATIDGKTAKRYAKALFELCEDQALEATRDALLSFSEGWRASAELRDVVHSPVIPQGEKLIVVQDISEQLCPGDKIFANFLALLLSNRRLGGTEEIGVELSTLIDELELGYYFLEVIDQESKTLLYSRGFSSIFGEWQSLFYFI